VEIVEDYLEWPRRQCVFKKEGIPVLSLGAPLVE